MAAEQFTIANAVGFSGVGVHSGVIARVRLTPAAAGSGIVFVRVGAASDAEIPAHIDNVRETTQCTALSNASGAQVSTVEHLLAACSALGVDNLRIEVEGPEIPILDGSAAPFARLLLQAGLKAQGAPRRIIEIVAPVVAQDGEKRASLEPAMAPAFDATIRFTDPAIGVQRFALEAGAQAMLREILSARTFGFMRDLERFRAMGLARGASLENTIAIEDGRVLNPEGLRYPDEFVRHKILDAAGDLLLAGGAILGRYVADQPGHALNAALVRTLMATPSAWRWMEADAPARRAPAIGERAAAYA